MAQSPATSTVSAHIAEDKSSLTTRVTFRISLKPEDGKPVAGEEVLLRLEGDGSFAPNFKSESIRREMDANGQAEFTWYRRSIFGRDVKATIIAEALNPGFALSLEQVTEKKPELKISFVKEEIKIRPPKA